MLHFGILGPLEIRHGNRNLALGGRNARVLLAKLLCNAGEPISDDSIIDAIWGATPPRSGTKNLHLYVHQLRRLLGSDRIVRHTHGYSVVVGEGELDAQRFRDGAVTGRQAAARGDEEGARSALIAALDLWRGPVFADLATVPALAEEILLLTEQRLEALEDRIELDLRLGAAPQVVVEVGALLRANPLRERLRGLYMTALYRCGRKGEALQVFQEGRRHLVDELGVEPDEMLQRIHVAILNGTDPQTTASAATPSSAGGLRRADRDVPRQLPADLAGFTGRKGELDALTAVLEDPRTVGVRLAVVSGMPGVGKTALAVHWAHQIAGRFPDGQLYLNLRGYDRAEPMSAGEALASLLRSLDVAPDRIPVETTECAALFRSLLSGRRMLVVLDNARTADQVRPLIPAGAGNLVLVTSRHHLGGLVVRDGAASLTLDVLSPAEADQLLGFILGDDRLGREPDAAVRVSRLCAYLPLALRIAAAQISESPLRSLRSYATELSGTGRLGALAIDGDEQSAVRSAFDLSYAALDPGAQRVFRLLGVVAGTDFTVDAVAALTGLTPRQALHELERLISAHLVHRLSSDRYGWHDLLREYACEFAAADHDGSAARERLNGWYLAAVNRCVDLALPYVVRLGADSTTEQQLPAIHGAEQAMAWLDDEFTNLVATLRYDAEHIRSPLVWRLADGLRGYASKRWHLTFSLEIADLALSVAKDAGDPRGQAVAHMLAANIHEKRSAYPEAIEHLRRSRDLSVAGQWPEFELTSMTNLAIVYFETGQLLAARDLLEDVLPRARAMWPSSVAGTLVVFGAVLLDMGFLDEAMAMGREAVEATRRLGGVGNRANALLFLGTVLRELGRTEDALLHIAMAADIQHDLGDHDHETWCWAHISMTYDRAGKWTEAQAAAERAIAMSEHATARHTIAEACNAAAACCNHFGDFDRAVRLSTDAYEIAHSAGTRRLETVATLHLATALAGQNAVEDALVHAERAHASALDGGYAPLAVQAQNLLESLRYRL